MVRVLVLLSLLVAVRVLVVGVVAAVGSGSGVGRLRWWVSAVVPEECAVDGAAAHLTAAVAVAAELPWCRCRLVCQPGFEEVDGGGDVPVEAGGC